MADVPPAPGRASAPRLILQGHLDMVCAVRPGSGWNPLTDPVAVVEEGGFLRSDGRSSLGADNHLGNAAALWLLSTGAVKSSSVRPVCSHHTRPSTAARGLARSPGQPG